MSASAESLCLPRPETHFGLAGLKQLRPDWQSLFDRVPCPGVHLSWEYHEALLKYGVTHPDKVLFVCVRDSSGEPSAIAALQPKRRKIAKIPFLAWQPPDDPDRPVMDFLVAPGTDPQAMRAALGAELKKIRPDIGLLAADRVREGSAAWQSAAAAPGSFRAFAFGSFLNIDTSDTPGLAVEKLGKKLRSNLRRGWRDLDRAGSSQCRVVHDPEVLTSELDAFGRLEASGWKGRDPEGNAILLQPQLRHRLQSMVVSLAREGMSEVHSLWSGQECLASLVVCIGGGEMYLLKTTYNEAWAASSPGHLLLQRVLERCGADPAIKSFNVGWEAGWIKPWNPRQHRLWSVYSGLGGWRSLFAAKLLTLRGASNVATVPRATAN